MANSDIEAIKDAQCNFLSFLWKEFIGIYELIHEKKYYIALDNLGWLIRGMPEDFQIKFGFKDKTAKMLQEIGKITSNSPLTFRREMDLNDARNIQAKEALLNILPEFSVMLDKKGYMERKGPSIEYGSE